MSLEQKILRTVRTLVLVGGVLSAIILWGVQWWLERTGPQPIAFKHSVHVGERGIQCFFCHTGVEKGDIAGVPSVQDCMQCHQVINPSASSSLSPKNAPEIAKLTNASPPGYWERKEEISWNKVYKVPKHVHFSHKAHVAYFGADPKTCALCHGDVGTMETVKPAHKMTMGFCIDCHVGNAGKTGPTGLVAPPRQVLVDCVTCHR